MKNIKRFQSDICHEEKSDKHVNRLIEAVAKNDENVSIFFSGIISSFVSTLLTMILISNDWVDNVLLRILVIVLVFLLAWFIIANWVVPIIIKFKSERKKTIIDELPNQEIISFFNSTIVLTSLELKDTVNIILDKEQDQICVDNSTTIVVTEFFKCVKYITSNVKSNHIRFYSQRSQKLTENYINEYTLVLVYHNLWEVGKQLTAFLDNLDSKKEEVALLKYDLQNAIDDFNHHRKYLKINSIVFE